MKIIYSLLIILLFSSCLKEDKLIKEYSGNRPMAIGDDWLIGSNLENNVDSVALDNVFRSVHDNDENWPLKSLVVFRNGELIAESYLKSDLDRTEPQAMWSCTKQIMALVIGTLIDDNELFLTDRAEQHLERYFTGHKDKEAITVENLLTMHSGISFNNDEHSDVFRKKETNNSVGFVLDLDLNYKPGSHFNYNDGDPQLLSAIVQEITHEKTDVYATRRIFSVIGMNNSAWERYPDGITLGGFGIHSTPRELAKIGQLVLNKGLWNNKRIVSEAWIDEMLSLKSDVENYDDLGFGYYWWINKKKNYRFMWGHGGQYLFLIPDKNAMIVMTSMEQLASEVAVWVEDATAIVDQVNETLK